MKLIQIRIYKNQNSWKNMQNNFRAKRSKVVESNNVRGAQPGGTCLSLQAGCLQGTVLRVKQTKSLLGALSLEGYACPSMLGVSRNHLAQKRNRVVESIAAGGKKPGGTCMSLQAARLQEHPQNPKATVVTESIAIWGAWR